MNANVDFNTLVSIALGIGLAAATGFRVFMPLFALSLSAYFGLWPINENWQWLASLPALIILGVAMAVETAAYLIPFVDNLLDTLAVPLAGLAGTAVMASAAADLSPAVTWTLAVIAGGGAAVAVKGTAAAVRAGSSAATGGLANPVVAAAETGSAVLITVLSLFLPLIALGLVLLSAVWLWRRLKKRRAAGTT